MAWTLYGFTRGGINLYVSSHATQPAAENAADKTINNGYLGVPDLGGGPDWIFPFASGEILVLWVKEEVDPGPNAVATDIIDGIDL